MKYRMVERCRDAFPVRMMCRQLGVSASGFYDWLASPLSARAQDNERLLVQIREIHANSDGVYGAPRIWDELRYRGEKCGKHRIARLMVAEGLEGVLQPKRWRKKRSSVCPDDVTYHLKHDFQADSPNTKCVTDIQYIRTGEHYLYLCVVLDLYSRVVVGWSMSHRQDRQLVLQAVLMALWQREDRSPVVLRSDRECQFTSDEYQRFLKGHHLVCGMSAVGSCADNAACQGFFGMLKRERVYRRGYRSHAEARADIFDYVERFYHPNRRRMAALETAKAPLTQLCLEMG